MVSLWNYQWKVSSNPLKLSRGSPQATFFFLFAVPSLRAAAAPSPGLPAAFRLLLIPAPKRLRPLPMLAWSSSHPTNLMILMPLS